MSNVKMPEPTLEVVRGLESNDVEVNLYGNVKIGDTFIATEQAEAYAQARVNEVLERSTSETDELPISGHDRLLKASASMEARDGIGAMDALYDLAVKHGANRAAASGFAHVANGAFAILEGMVCDEIRRRVRAEKFSHDAYPAPAGQEAIMSKVKMTVSLVSFPESNGKRNWTGMFIRTNLFKGLADNCGGVTIAQGELWNRVAYMAERGRVLLGERSTEPDILQYAEDVKTPEEWKGNDPEGIFVIRALKEQS